MDLTVYAREFLSPRDIDVVVYHSPCCDGFGSAFVAWLLLGDKVHYIPLDYMKQASFDVEALRGKNVLMTDVSFNKERFSYVKSIVKKILLLDHHKSAMLELKDVSGCFFDMGRSGVGISWAYFFPDTPMPVFLQHIQDRDIWTWHLPNSKAFTAAFYDFIPYDFSRYNEFLSESKVAEFVTKGNAILEYIEAGVAQDAKKAVLHKMGDFTVKVVNSTHRTASDLGNYLSREGCDFAAIWCYDHEMEQISVSLRGRAGGVDVSAVAKKYGGGGHPAASGFSWKGPIQELFTKL